MTHQEFKSNLRRINGDYEKLIATPNYKIDKGNGVCNRYKNPILTAQHLPPFWRYDYNYETNPFLLERLGVNGAFNAGACEHNGKILLFVRVEGVDRKSFFAIAESRNGIDKFRFWDYPIIIPQTSDPDTNVYDIRITHHEDGWIYGLFCTERKDNSAPRTDTSSAVAQCGIVRTKDFKRWERLPDIKSKSPQQRNVVLHPEFIHGKYAFYTRPQDGFVETGTGGGIGWGLSDSIENVVIESEIIIDDRVYHTIKEVKNGLGPPPIKTEKGWLQLAHGVRNTAAGLRYVLYLFLTDLRDPAKIIAHPQGYFLAPKGPERVGDVSNVLFCNGWVKRESGKVLIYYASSDTRMHVATSTVNQLLDYVLHTPEDGLRSDVSVQQRYDLISKNLKLMKK
jgi:4-O-beta-D-mannosyl-D-glucose phosphorylase